MEVLDALNKLGNNLTIFGVLVIFIWVIISGKLKTEGHHQEVVETLKESEARGWAAAGKAQTELAEINKVNDKLADSLAELTRTLVVEPRRR